MTLPLRLEDQECQRLVERGPKTWEVLTRATTADHVTPESIIQWIDERAAFMPRDERVAA